MKLSIVIPAYNEEKLLPRLLKSIIAQNYPCEIIVADAESTDSTAMIARAFGCKVVNARRGLPAFARNVGALAASGDLLIFLDADVKLPLNFLRRTMREMRMKDYDIAGCYVDPDTNKIFDRFIMSGVVNTWYSLFEKFWPNIIGCCIFVKKDVHRAIGGFDETITFAEDAAYVYKAHKKGFRFGILKSGRVAISMRRFEREGRVNLSLRYAIYTLSRFAGEIKREVNYKYGHY